MIELTPKARFQSGPHAKAHAELVVLPAFHAALEASLASLSLTHNITQEQLSGARALIVVLLNLAEPPEKPDTAPLSHNLWPQPQPPKLTRQQLLEKVEERRKPQPM